MRVIFELDGDMVVIEAQGDHEVHSAVMKQAREIVAQGKAPSLFIVRDHHGHPMAMVVNDRNGAVASVSAFAVCALLYEQPQPQADYPCEAPDESEDSFDNEYGYTEEEHQAALAQWADYCARQREQDAREAARRKWLMGQARRAKKQKRAIERAKEARRFEFWPDPEPLPYEAEETVALLRAKARDNDLQNRWNDRVGHAWAKNKRNVESRSMDRAKAKRRKVGPWLLNP